MIKKFEEFINEQYNNSLNCDAVNEGFFRDLLHIGKTGEDLVDILTALTKEYFTDVEYVRNMYRPYWKADKNGIFVAISNKELKNRYNQQDQKTFLNSDLFDAVKPIQKVKSDVFTKFYYIKGNFVTRNSESDYNSLARAIKYSPLYRYMAHELQDSKFAKELEKLEAEYQLKKIKKEAAEAEKRAHDLDVRQKAAEKIRMSGPTSAHAGEDYYGGTSAYDAGLR